MHHQDFNAHEGLKEGRRVNPGPAKLPAQKYLKLSDILLVMFAFCTAAILIFKGVDLWAAVEQWVNHFRAAIEARSSVG